MDKSLVSEQVEEHDWSMGAWMRRPAPKIEGRGLCFTSPAEKSSKPGLVESLTYHPQKCASQYPCWVAGAVFRVDST